LGSTNVTDAETIKYRRLTADKFLEGQSTTHLPQSRLWAHSRTMYSRL